MHSIRVIVLAGVVVSAAYALGQDATSPKSNAANGGEATYSNECLALTYRLPDGWEFAKLPHSGASHQSNGKMSLFKIQRRSAAASAEWLSVDVMNTPLQHPNMERFTTLLALSYVQVDPQRTKITRNAYPVTIAGRSFFRSDLSRGDDAVALITTWYRGYAIVVGAKADSPQDLEGVTNALRPLSFGEDKRTADCFDPTNSKHSE